VSVDRDNRLPAPDRRKGDRPGGRRATDRRGKVPCPECGHELSAVCGGEPDPLGRPGYSRPRRCANPSCKVLFYTLETYDARRDRMARREGIRNYEI
jgi:hypothetical protein